MLKNVVVALDGSFTAEKIVPWVQDYAGREEAEVHLVSAVPRDTFRKAHERLRKTKDALAYLEKLSRRLNKAGIENRVTVRPGHPARVVIDQAKKVRADLIAFTTRGASKMQRTLLGGVAKKILALSDRPVLIAQASVSAPKPFRIDQILVPVDGSPLSDSAIPAAAGLAGIYGSKILLLHVRNLQNPAGFDKGRFEGLCKKLEHAGIEARYRVSAGDPAVSIQQVANRRGISLVAMNSHGRSGFTKLMLGSVAEEVIYGVEVPVLVTRNRKSAVVKIPKVEPITAG